MLGKARQNFALNAFFFFLPASWAMVFLTLIALPSHAQPFQPVPDRAESFTRPAYRGDDESPFKPRRASAFPPPHSITIGPVFHEKISAETGAAPRPGTPHKIGFGRDIAELGRTADTAARLQWQNTPQGGKIAAFSITSPQAAGVRLGVLVRRLPAEATLRFYPQGAGAAYEISAKEVLESLQRNLDAGDSSDEARTYWSPYVEGEEATLEIELPLGISPDALEIAIPRVSHFFSFPLAAQGENITKIGQAASCEIDVSCYSDWGGESNATARMIFVNSGSSYSCSGTLLNDTVSSGTPYFLSANHCISKQTVASTLQTYWFYRSTACNSGSLNPGYQTRTGGATLLYAGNATDTSFMQLRSTPPAGAVYAAWSAVAPSTGISVTGIHHPKADLQKISFGSLQSYQVCTNSSTGIFSCSEASQANGQYLNIVYAAGGVESGSSGSGLFRTIGSSHYLIGQLYGGDSSCSNPSGENEYGRFDRAYNAALYQWLTGGSAFFLSVSKPGKGIGTVTSSPTGIDCGASCGAPFAGGTSVTLTATPGPGSTFSDWSGACSGAGPSCLVVMNAANSVTATFAIDTIALGVALDNTRLLWTTGGDVPFAAQTATSYYGGSALQTGKIGNNQSTYLATTMTGPGTLSWYWNVSSEDGYDFFTVYLDGATQYRWSGQGSWTRNTLDIPAGNHTVKWEYVKDDFVASGQDAGWVDYVTLSGACCDTAPVYRFFNTNTGGHFFTISEAEKNTVIQNYPWFRFEQTGFYAFAVQAPGSLPVYRFFNTNTGGHFFTISEAEKNTVIQNYPSFRFEQTGFYAFAIQQPGSLPVYRFFNTTTGGHFFTISETEKNTVIQNYPWFRFEQTGFYAYSSP